MFTPGSVHLSYTQKAPTAPVQARIRNLGPVLEKLPAVMRKGEGSVQDQFHRQQTMARNGRVSPWPRTKPFGRDTRPQARGMKRNGRYLAAWLGEGPGSITSVRGNAVAIGVSRGAFPQVRVFQSATPTAIRVTPKMRVYLGMAKGVWLKRSTTLIRIEPRAFAVNPPMIRRARAILVNYVANGKAEAYMPGGGLRRAA